MSMSFNYLVNDHRIQFGVPDTIRVLVKLHGYSVDEARELIRRLKEDRIPQQEVTG